MYCLQWFLPLVLLSRPVAPPVFLLTYLLSMALHHRPCVTCTAAFAGVFLAACALNGACWIETRAPFYSIQTAHWDSVHTEEGCG